PRKSFFAAIAEALLTQQHHQAPGFGASLLSNAFIVVGACDRPQSQQRALILQQHAGNFAALEILAGVFRLFLFEPCETRAEHRLVALLRALRERVGAAELILGLALRRTQPLLGLVLGAEGADLNKPGAARLGRGLGR